MSLVIFTNFSIIWIRHSLQFNLHIAQDPNRWSITFGWRWIIYFRLSIFDDSRSKSPWESANRRLIMLHKRIDKITPTKLFGLIINIALLIATLVFVEQLVQEYMEGNTNFSVTKKPMNENDIPTATICIQATMELNYGKDFYIVTLNTTTFGQCAAVSNYTKVPYKGFLGQRLRQN